jgi:hypothetical protein
MKNKFTFLFVIVTIALLITPTQAFAFTGISGYLVDAINGDPWNYGGYVYIGNQTAGEVAGEGSFSGDYFEITYTNPPSDGDQLIVYIFPNTGPEGTPPYIISGPHTEATIIPVYLPLGTLVVQSGPTSVELVDFSITPQSNGNTWLLFVLLVGSVALVSGAVVILRKKRA